MWTTSSYGPRKNSYWPKRHILPGGPLLMHTTVLLDTLWQKLGTVCRYSLFQQLQLITFSESSCSGEATGWDTARVSVTVRSTHPTSFYHPIDMYWNNMQLTLHVNIKSRDVKSRRAPLFKRLMRYPFFVIPELFTANVKKQRYPFLIIKYEKKGNYIFYTYKTL